MPARSTAVLASVGIEAAAGQSRLAAAEPFHCFGGQFDGIANAFPGQKSRHVAVANMDRDERAGDRVGGEHHARLVGLGHVREDGGVA